ncbi:MAG: hypothetical protein ACREPA_03415 [Candidatus Dormibacteraceae bacterium]
MDSHRRAVPAWLLRAFGQVRPGASGPQPPPVRRAAAGPEPAPSGTRCRWPDCPKAASWRCGYRDGTGRRCDYWCDEHLERDGDHTWCRRHSNTIRRLSARAGTIYEIKSVAQLDDRGPNLVASLAEELGPEVRAMLIRYYGEMAGHQIVSDPAIRESRTTKPAPGSQEGDGHAADQLREESGWQIGWGACTSQGYVWRASLRVTRQEPPVVQLVINSRVVYAAVPDWIAGRERGPAGDGQDRVHFRARILGLIESSLRESPRDPVVEFTDPAELNRPSAPSEPGPG